MCGQGRGRPHRALRADHCVVANHIARADGGCAGVVAPCWTERHAIRRGVSSQKEKRLRCRRDSYLMQSARVSRSLSGRSEAGGVRAEDRPCSHKASRADAGVPKHANARL